ncbi:hypothetical protein [Bacillus sp. FJAT-45037]|uniref:hypothetical protein n=1 Tax=Bacillus sp. FJAT-45037 TaxID=2011007 RepID=UPI000C2439B0|nr:hypothetical protein [Bacillus sp. FJAT-45037]
MSSFKLDVESNKNQSKQRFQLELLQTSNNERTDLLEQKKKKDRKVRSDKKVDIKTPITMEQKQKLMILARQESVKEGVRVSITQMASRLVQEGLFTYESFPDCEYDPNCKSVHVKLTQFFSDQLFNFELEWDVAKRVAAARVLTYMLKVRNIDEV